MSFCPKKMLPRSAPERGIPMSLSRTMNHWHGALANEIQDQQVDLALECRTVDSHVDGWLPDVFIPFRDFRGKVATSQLGEIDYHSLPNFTELTYGFIIDHSDGEHC